MASLVLYWQSKVICFLHNVTTIKWLINESFINSKSHLLSDMSLDSLDALLDREWIDDSLSSDVRGFYSRRKSKRELVPRVIAVADKIAENDGDLAYDFLSFSLEKMAMARRAASAEVLVETTEKVAEIAPEIAETYVANFGNHINENAFLDTIHYVPRVIG